jgi:chemotaxis protein methyltransferase CheR
MSFQQVKLTEAQFKKFSELIHQQAGIHLKPEKIELLNTRLGKRLRACNLDSFRKYYDLVVSDQTGSELVQLLNSVSTNFTSFFRESSHFDFLASTILPQFCHEHKGGKEIRLWSAACSSGEEPYTMAMVIDQFFAHHPGRRYRIMATDISTKVLAQAEQGVYPMDRLEKVPAELLRKYFQKGTGRNIGQARVKDQIKRNVSFQRFNLMADFPWRDELQVIFCRNAMIYFNRATQEELINKFYHCLTEGGYLLIGHSESLASFSHGFKQVAATAYRKV